MVKLVYKAHASGTLASALAVGATTATVQTGEGAEFGTIAAGEGMWLRLFKGDRVNPTQVEFVLCTAVAGDSLTITRMQQGTADQAWDPDDTIENVWTPADAEAIQYDHATGDLFAPANIRFAVADSTIGTANAYYMARASTLRSYANGSMILEQSQTQQDFHAGYTGHLSIKRDVGVAIGEVANRLFSVSAAGNATAFTIDDVTGHASIGAAPDANATVLIQDSDASAAAPSANDVLWLERNLQCHLTLATNTTGTAVINFSDTSAGRARVEYAFATDVLKLVAASSEMMRLSWNAVRIESGVTADPRYLLDIVSAAGDAFTIDDTTGHVGICTTPHATHPVRISDALASNGVLLVESTGNAAGTVPLEVLAPNLGNGNVVFIGLGVAGSTFNRAAIGFTKVSSGSADNHVGIGFYGSGGDVFAIDCEGRAAFGDGGTNPDSSVAQLIVNQHDSAAAIPVLALDQDDIDDAFINFIGTSATDGSRSLSSDTGETAAKTVAVRCEHNGTTFWLRGYAAHN